MTATKEELQDLKALMFGLWSALQEQEENYVFDTEPAKEAYTDLAKVVGRIAEERPIKPFWTPCNGPVRGSTTGLCTFPPEQVLVWAPGQEVQFGTWDGEVCRAGNFFTPTHYARVPKGPE